MILERFLAWAAEAPALARADAARAIVSAYGQPGNDRQRLAQLDRMVMVLLDDPVVAVRRALAEAAATSIDIPHAAAVALSRDDGVVAAPVLRLSPRLTAADLVDAIALGDSGAHRAVAGRRGLDDVAAAALVEVGDAETAVVLCRNGAANLGRATLRRVLARFGADPDIREAVAERAELDPVVRHDLVLATAQALTGFAVACDWMSEQRASVVGRESLEKAVVAIAATCAAQDGADDLEALTQHLRAEGHLTPALLLRALLSGNVALFASALALLAGASGPTVLGHVRNPDGLGFASLYAKAAMPPLLLPVFRAAASTAGRCDDPESSATLLQPAVEHVLDACLDPPRPELAKVVALLRRFEAEALRDSTRVARRALAVAPHIVDRPQSVIWMLPRRPAFRLPFRTAA